VKLAVLHVNSKFSEITHVSTAPIGLRFPVTFDAASGRIRSFKDDFQSCVRMSSLKLTCAGCVTDQISTTISSTIYRKHRTGGPLLIFNGGRMGAVYVKFCAVVSPTVHPVT
jgi:hypothetical protein